VSRGNREVNNAKCRKTVSGTQGGGEDEIRKNYFSLGACGEFVTEGGDAKKGCEVRR